MKAIAFLTSIVAAILYCLKKGYNHTWQFKSTHVVYIKIYDKLRLLLLAGSGLDLVTSDLRVFLEV